MMGRSWLRCGAATCLNAGTSALGCGGLSPTVSNGPIADLHLAVPPQATTLLCFAVRQQSLAVKGPVINRPAT